MCFEYLNHLTCVPWSRPTLSNDNERLLGRGEQINSLADAAWAGAHRWWWRTVLQIPEAHQTRLTSLKSEHCSSGIHWETERGELSGWGWGEGLRREIHRDREKDGGRDRARDSDRHTERQRETHTETLKKRRKAETERRRERQRQREVKAKLTFKLLCHIWK